MPTPLYFQRPLHMSPIPIPHMPPKPLLRLRIADLSHPGSVLFLRTLDASATLSLAVREVHRLLYPRAAPIPPTRSVTLHVEAMDGVANTSGIALDADHKAIRLSAGYIAGIEGSRVKDEVTGVLVHEMVHAWQWNGQGHAPGGLVEGIADWVRLRAGFSPPHWKREGGRHWDAGYQTTGYFLAWLEETKGEDAVVRINAELRKGYQEETFWKGLFGVRVAELWEQYVKTLEHPKEDSIRHPAIPTHAAS